MTAPPLARRIRARRRDLGMTQAELGRRLGTLGSWVSGIERGTHCPHVSRLPRLAAELDTTVGYLVTGQTEDEDTAPAEQLAVPLSLLEWAEAAGTPTDHVRKLWSVALAIRRWSAVELEEMDWPGLYRGIARWL